MTTTDYVDMYRHVVERLRTHDVDNVVYVMNYMGFERWAPIVDELYPGDDVVNWIAYDPYGSSAHTTFADMVDSANDAGWPGFYSWAIERWPDKPIMLAEWGLDPEIQPAASTLLAQAPDTLRNDFPNIKAAVYWNDKGRRVDARLRDTNETTERYWNTYRQIADDPYFNETSTDQAP
jgi:beta-mannanase